MRTTTDVFHLAIPVRDLDEAFHFYVKQLGCKLARRYDDRITLDFFGDQVVCHLAPDEIPLDVKLYPRHFGVTFHNKDDFDRLFKLCKVRKIKMLTEPEKRFPGLVEEHLTMQLVDPSNNILEFKHYNDPRMMY